MWVMVPSCSLRVLTTHRFPCSPFHLPKANPAGSLDHRPGNAGRRDEGKQWGGGGVGQGRVLGVAMATYTAKRRGQRWGGPGNPCWAGGGEWGWSERLCGSQKPGGGKEGDLGSLNQDLEEEENEESNPSKSLLAVGRVPREYRDETPGSWLVSLLRNRGRDLSLPAGAAVKGVGRPRCPARK